MSDNSEDDNHDDDDDVRNEGSEESNIDWDPIYITFESSVTAEGEDYDENFDNEKKQDTTEEMTSP